MMPPLFIAIALFTAMDYLNIQPGLLPIVVGHLVVVIPFVLVVVTARLQRFDIELEQAARDLGAGVAQTLRRITLPIVLPGVVGAALLAFAFSFDEVLITNFTSGTTTTLPLLHLLEAAPQHRSVDQRGRDAPDGYPLDRARRGGADLQPVGARLRLRGRGE